MHNNVINGIKKFLQLTALTRNPLESKWIQHEENLIEALEVCLQKFRDTMRMFGKQKYQGQDFDPIDDVKKEMEEYLLVGREPVETAKMKRRNLVMYHLVIEPVIDIFADYSHAEMLGNMESIFEQVFTAVNTTQVSFNYDDAVVAKAQIQALIREREEIRKANAPKRRVSTRRRPVEKEIESFLSTVEPTPEVNVAELLG